jgi:formylglycine-generating enzyme required for sulfatase activity
VYPSAVRAALVFVLSVTAASPSPPARPAAPTFEAHTGRATVVHRPLEAMVPIHGGLFTMGASAEVQNAALELCREEISARNRHQCVRDAVDSEGPQQRVFVSDFSIDRVEVTVASYRACVRAGACAPTPLALSDSRFIAPEFPITSVTYDEASDYCSWRGARLPTEAEWERAARGTDGRVWPWGNVLKPNALNHGRFVGSDDVDGSDRTPLIRPDASDGAAFLAPVGAHPDGASPEGVLDMAGNVMEWTADYYRPESPQSLATVNPHGPDVGAMRSVRGGSWRQPPFFARTSYREAAAPETRSTEIGFRCAR